MVSDSISINSISGLGNVTHDIHMVSKDLEVLYAHKLKHLSTHLNAALSGSALGQFEPRFLNWLAALYNLAEDMDAAYTDLALLHDTAKLLADALSKIDYTDTPTPNPF